jgi:hypothetical protein
MGRHCGGGREKACFSLGGRQDPILCPGRARMASCGPSAGRKSPNVTSRARKAASTRRRRRPSTYSWLAGSDVASRLKAATKRFATPLTHRGGGRQDRLRRADEMFRPRAPLARGQRRKPAPFGFKPTGRFWRLLGAGDRMLAVSDFFGLVSSAPLQLLPAA